MIQKDLLHALADGELDARTRAEIEAALSPEEREQVSAIAAYRLEIRTRVDVIDHATAWKAARGRLDEIDRARRVETFVGRYAWGMVGAFGLLIVGVGVKNRALDPGRIENADLARMAASLGGSRAATALPDNQRVLLDGLLAGAARSLDPNRLSLVRPPAQAQMDGHILTRYWLRDASGDLGLLVVAGEVELPEFERNGDGFSRGMLGSQPCVAWKLGDSTLLLAGDRNSVDLKTLALRISRN